MTKGRVTPHINGAKVFNKSRQSAPHLIRFLGPTRVHSPDSILISSAS